MSEKEGSIPDYFGVIEPYDRNYALTKNTGLIGAIELSGRDPDGLDMLDHAGLSAIAQAIYGKLNRNITVTEYYAHFDGVKITLREREDPICNTLSQRRAAYLNDLNLSGSRIVHYFEIEPEENINKLHPGHLLKHIGMSAFDKRSRLLVKNSMSIENSFLVELHQLEAMQKLLTDAIQEVTARWAGLFEVRQLNIQEMWAHMRFLAGMNPAALDTALNEAIPEEDLDVYLSPGDIKTVLVNKMDVLKISGVTNRYLKIGAVRRFSRMRGQTKPGLWAASEKSPVRLNGNYLIMTRWKPLSEFQRDVVFSRKNATLQRESMNFFAMMTGNENRSAVEKQAELKPTIKAKMDELAIAESVPDIWGIGHSYICVFGDDPEKVRDTATRLEAATGDAKINITWESVYLEHAFKAMQPGQARASKRNLFLTSSQFAAAALIYQSSIGQLTVPDLENEEAYYPLQSKDGKVFHYSPFIGGRAMVICIGPIRSGKTFFKNCIATHFQKYGGIYRAIDIDPGSEIVAGLFGDDAGIFRVTNDPRHGANIFASYRGKDDDRFRIHINQLLHLFLQVNDAEENRKITADEQDQMDKAIDRALELPDELRNLAALIACMPKALRVKFSRWVRKQDDNQSGSAGWYAHLFDADKDAIGNLRKRIGVFNLQALKDTQKLLVPVQADILYRITQAFEDPELRHLPKLLDLDECHYPLSIPTFAEYIVQKIRTWGKWFGSVQMWTQSPEELEKTPGWAAIRTAATTFIFMADPNMDEKIYKSTFPFLSSGELKAIRELTPKREAYIIQPEIGVSKVVVIDAEPEQRVVNTSHPAEAAIRERYIKQYGFQEGLRRAVDELTAVGFQENEVEHAVTSRLKVVPQ